MTQQDEATRARLSKRAVSMETRRFAAIRLAATSTSLSQVRVIDYILMNFLACKIGKYRRFQYDILKNNINLQLIFSKNHK